MDGKIVALLNSTKPDLKVLPGGWEAPNELIPDFQEHTNSSVELLPRTQSDCALVIKNGLTKTECDALIKLMNRSPNFESVSIQGRKDVPDYRQGSVRTSVWSPNLAIKLWRRLKDSLYQKTRMTDTSSTDWWQGDRTRRIWETVGITPLLRFMKYPQNGQHYAHYDAGFIYPDDKYRTLQSMVIYLTSCEKDGRTRFIKDAQEKLPIWDRDHRDWTREVKTDEVLTQVKPSAGDILVFDHRICHDVEKYTGESPRIIIRGDVLFKAVS